MTPIAQRPAPTDAQIRAAVKRVNEGLCAPDGGSFGAWPDAPPRAGVVAKWSRHGTGADEFEYRLGTVADLLVLLDVAMRSLSREERRRDAQSTARSA